MRVVIESIQDFGTHKDSMKEEYRCELIDGKIIFENGSIEVLDNKLMYYRGNSQMIIEKGGKNEYIYKSEYGDILFLVEGLELEKDSSMIRAKYKMYIQNGDAYINEITIRLM